MEKANDKRKKKRGIITKLKHCVVCVLVWFFFFFFSFFLFPFALGRKKGFFFSPLFVQKKKKTPERFPQIERGRRKENRKKIKKEKGGGCEDDYGVRRSATEISESYNKNNDIGILRRSMADCLIVLCHGVRGLLSSTRDP